MSRPARGAVSRSSIRGGEDHFLFGRPIKKVDILTGISLRSGNLPTEFLENDLVFLNPEILFVIRPRPFFKRLSVEARLNVAFIQTYLGQIEDQYIKVPGFGLSVGYILKEHPR